MKNEKISVIIPIYNTDEYLEKCIDSVCKQTYKNLEIILINDGSKDNSGKICEKFKLNDERIIYIDKENTGVSDSRNHGIDISSGDYILFVDSDDYLDLNMIEILHTNLKKYNTDLSVCEYRNVTQTINQFNKEEALVSLFDINGIQGYLWNKLYKTEIIKNNKIMFNKQVTICEDLLFNAEYISYINSCIFDKKQLYNYVIRPDSALNKKFNEKWLTHLEAYSLISKFYLNENKCLSDIYKWNFTITNINAKTKIKLNNYKNKEIEKKINKNIKLYLKEAMFSKNIKFKKRIKIFVYYYAFYIILFLKKYILKKK